MVESVDAEAAAVATKVAPSKSTGGGGFVFENDVCAWLLASMLVREPIFGKEYGAPVRLDFQVLPDGWFMDDVLVTTEVEATRHRFALSIKSNVQFTAKSAPSDFVAAAWKQWLHVGSTVFDVDRDFMGLVTAPLSHNAAKSIQGLSGKARKIDPDRFPDCLTTGEWANQKQRSLFTSFTCPGNLSQEKKHDETARLLRRLRFLQHDFGGDSHQSENNALELCRRAVRSHTDVDAQNLWSILGEIASDLRPHAGDLTLRGLIDRLRARAQLAEYPNHVEDWDKIDSRSTREAGPVRNSIGKDIHLPREEEVTAIINLLEKNDRVALLGPSGVGKSALAKAVFESRRKKSQRTLWIDASVLDRMADFGTFETSLQLRHPLVELLDKETGQDPLVIIDGLDRLYSKHAFNSVATLLRILGGGQPDASWRILAICQSQEWLRVFNEIQSTDDLIINWSHHEVKAPKQIDLRPVRGAVPALERLFLQPRVGDLFTNLKILDLVVRRLDSGAEIDASQWVGESNVAEWFWNAEIHRGEDGIKRGQFARKLALAQADDLVPTVAVDAFEASLLDAAQSLIGDQLLVPGPEDHLAFAHDIYGDWARLRILLNHKNNIAKFLQDRYESPLWQRAIRLLGIHLLERANGVDEWKKLMSSFDSGDKTIVRDILLEAPVFAMNAGTLLDSIFPDLVSGDGALLRRLVTRFLAFATVPNKPMLEIARSIGADVNEVRATYRRPHWPYWLDVLEVLYSHRDDALRVAPSEIARVVEMWLEFLPSGHTRRRKVAELAVMLGQKAHDTKDVYGEREDRERLYKCALLAASERPDEVAGFAKTAAERVPRPTSEEAHIRPRSRGNSGSVVMRGPWPDGPRAQVDDAFENVVLNSGTIHHLYKVRPVVAREVILATLIEAPHEEQRGGIWTHEREFGLTYRPKWWLPVFLRGPFLPCLRENFKEGLELIMRIIEFATERSNEYAAREVDKRRARAIADGHSPDEIDKAAQGAPSRHLALHDGTEKIQFIGDAGSYGWSAGMLSPPAVASALMALEQYFYQHLDAGQDITEEVGWILERNKCVAPLGVLSDVGKRQPSLFNGPLRALLSAPEIYEWEIGKTVQRLMPPMVGALHQGQYFTDIARRFHKLEHRNRDLRHVAMEQLLMSEDMRTFFATVRDWWKRRRAAGESLPKIAEQLDLCFNPTNYEQRQDPKCRTVIVNVALERMQPERDSEHQETNNRTLLFNDFSTYCWGILYGQQLQNDGQLEYLWQRWQGIQEFAEVGVALSSDRKRLGDEYVDAIMGGIAVFLWHEKWLARYNERRRSIKTAMETIVGALPEQSRFASAHDASTWIWDCFLAEASAFLWAREPADARWRRLVAQMVFAKKYDVVRLLFLRCATDRVVLGEDFERLRRLVLDWAHMRNRVVKLRSFRRGASKKEDRKLKRLQNNVDVWVDKAISAFVSGTLGPMPTDWDRFNEASQFAEIDKLPRRWSDSRVMDFHLVRCSHEWLPLPDDTLNPEERENVIQFWRIALDVVTARLQVDLQRRNRKYPCEDEAWVLRSVAAVVLQLRPLEKPEKFWEAIVDLHGDAHVWPEEFLNALHRCALSAEQTPTTYGPLVDLITRRAFSEVDGAKRWPSGAGVWDALLGIDCCGRDAWNERHADHIMSIRDVIFLWMEKAPKEGRRLAHFARWLSTPVAATVRLCTLTWFLQSLRAEDEFFIHRDEDLDDIAKLLNEIWDNNHDSLRATPESFAAFRGILAWLVERQNSQGLDLHGRIMDIS